MEEIVLDPIHQDEKFYGFEVELYEDINGVEVAVDLSGANIVMQFVNESGSAEKTLSTTLNTITIVANTIVVAEQYLDLYPGMYIFDFNIILSNGEKRTGLFKGRLVVEPIISKRT